MVILMLIVILILILKVIIKFNVITESYSLIFILSISIWLLKFNIY